MDKFLTLEAMENEEEDFVKCFKLFRLGHFKFDKEDFNKYNFIKEACLSLKEEENENT